ncbi:RpsP Ribosomal protein S16 [Pyrenophora tritici-repentis]|uniref:RpsP, Ribosomal protein S16 n=2 Tax=Pyrenophora tritici-repentis TaxID=45151 RepID=A0A2W1H0U3_9PLEO|nr:mitochondrial 37S ribosomal protein MRPS16 [Pyrenophora tritici-repentis Pt-1C-BFP]KAA8626906.1 mitochondrial 37s ribosomal protein mrps16 [Pyrenophora tritici-repentis]EDU41618.1 mitochondrial ribosomal protein s24 [Pyrenophora tritici-repentis Pt-1C-BFP]KAF7455341.1 mitochondrial 37s ribosomal protein mrps16 [Pyrenophora tritici-repentis]KAF7578527.1 RpsP, Ribosomal protein S16 [Pyrenophora tritici-repentis]KAG9389089.1 mitochondrial 37s ribosomal protein mrps16 [Pyrenophora tritici-repen
MVLRIRLARFGKKHAPFYNIVVAHARTARNSRPLEVLGTYDPKPQPPRPGDTHGRPWKDIKLDISRARYWVGVGAQPSDTAWRLLSMVGILEPQYRVGQIQGQVVKADSAHKSLIPESKILAAQPTTRVENMEGGAKHVGT